MLAMVKGRKHTRAGAAATALIIEVFRLNAALLAAGDALVGDLGLTSARWQVLGAVAMSDGPAPVAHLARAMGLQRQGVQRIVNELEAEGLLAFSSNPHHRRAKLVGLTDAGTKIYAAASALQVPWVNGLAKDAAADDLAAATMLLASLQARLAAREDRAT